MKHYFILGTNGNSITLWGFDEKEVLSSHGIKECNVKMVQAIYPYQSQNYQPYYPNGK